MHEMTIAREIAETVTRAATKASAKRVAVIELELGDLSFLDPANMEMWVRQALQDGSSRDAVINIDMAVSTLTCAGCGFQGPPEIPEYHDHHMPLPPPSCPRCGSPDAKLEAKDGCILKRLELEV